ncbi:hypothetical protein CS060_12735 [Anoxybacillus flavithermus]|uniref:Uncharacterized protein n=1 Tax=Anoxybacillus flavithermus TaxID=33934 RepID=A0A2G5RMB3_9BACL|nr:hypothetical protein JS80_01405 [Anoxybacillus sp. KU2-6(11)]PIC03867.1 hypothetical protein CS060_12735 [Anoxybacillus flavithermus]
MDVYSLLLTGCTGTKSFEGTLYSIGENHFVVDCSHEVKKRKNNVEDISYPCTVRITDQTKFSDENGNKLNVDDFTEGVTVKVILANPQTISQSKESRDIEAREIILLNCVGWFFKKTFAINDTLDKICLNVSAIPYGVVFCYTCCIDT